MKLFNSLSDKYDYLFLKNQQEFINKIKGTDYYAKDYVTFYPSFGVKQTEQIDFVFYGQAVNGWGSWLDENPSIDDVKDAKQFSNQYPNNTSFTPLDWVNVKWSNDELAYHVKENPEAATFFTGNEGNKKYRAHRSFFWNTIYKTVADYYKYERGGLEWSKKIVWSNLYKIAPDGDNPNEFEKESQINSSVELFNQELMELKPKYAILLTNEKWWLPFKERLSTVINDVPEHLNLITNYETLGSTKIVVTTRPRIGNGEEHTKQILEIINS